MERLVGTSEARLRECCRQRHLGRRRRHLGRLVKRRAHCARVGRGCALGRAPGAGSGFRRRVPGAILLRPGLQLLLRPLALLGVGPCALLLVPALLGIVPALRVGPALLLRIRPGGRLGLGSSLQLGSVAGLDLLRLRGGRLLGLRLRGGRLLGLRAGGLLGLRGRRRLFGLCRGSHPRRSRRLHLRHGLPGLGRVRLLRRQRREDGRVFATHAGGHDFVQLVARGDVVLDGDVEILGEDAIEEKPVLVGADRVSEERRVRAASVPIKVVGASVEAERVHKGNHPLHHLGIGAAVALQLDVGHEHGPARLARTVGGRDDGALWQAALHLKEAGSLHQLGPRRVHGKDVAHMPEARERLARLFGLVKVGHGVGRRAARRRRRRLVYVRHRRRWAVRRQAVAARAGEWAEPEEPLKARDNLLLALVMVRLEHHPAAAPLGIAHEARTHPALVAALDQRGAYEQLLVLGRRARPLHGTDRAEPRTDERPGVDLLEAQLLPGGEANCIDPRLEHPVALINPVHNRPVVRVPLVLRRKEHLHLPRLAGWRGVEAEEHAVVARRVERKHVVQLATHPRVAEGRLDVQPDEVDKRIGDVHKRRRHLAALGGRGIELVQLPDAQGGATQLHKALAPALAGLGAVRRLPVDGQHVAHQQIALHVQLVLEGVLECQRIAQVGALECELRRTGRFPPHAICSARLERLLGAERLEWLERTEGAHGRVGAGATLLLGGQRVSGGVHRHALWRVLAPAVRCAVGSAIHAARLPRQVHRVTWRTSLAKEQRPLY